MNRVLCVSSSERITEFLRDVFGHVIADSLVESPTVEQARQELENADFDYVVINGPVAGKHGCDFSIEVAKKHPEASVILIVREDTLDRMSEKVEDYGVFVVSKPINKTNFFNVLRLVAVARKKMFGLTDENIRLKARIEELRLIDRAKCTLISVLNISEQEAHRAIEKQAMDMRLTKKQVAENILRIYEDAAN